jgi:malonyl CoA-acyl carrier protein transacylase
LLKRKLEEELRRAKRKSMLNIQQLVVRLPLHSSSFLECAEGKVYKKKIQFAQTIIQDINTIQTFVIEFLHNNVRHGL